MYYHVAGTIVWQNFVENGPEVLRQLYFEEDDAGADAPADDEGDDEDWRELPVKEGRKRRIFYYNKRTGESQWDKPVAQEVEEDCPDIYDYLLREFQKADVTQDSVLGRDEFRAMMRKLVLRTNEEQTQVGIDQSGCCKWRVLTVRVILDDDCVFTDTFLYYCIYDAEIDQGT